MTLEDAAEIVRTWAKGTPIIKRVDFFGSRIRGNDEASSDLDVAVELKYNDPDTCLAYWFEHQATWQHELERLLPWKVDLQFHHSSVLGIVHTGVLDASRMIYRREA